ncbi:MAG: type II secretion system F family protein [Peptococcaceae bacterium]|nr:type II secretion system F family protein [Peptococcaceae bacterium]
MESVIIFSGSSLICFIILALFSKKLHLSLPQDRVLRSLGRISQQKKESEERVKPISKQTPRNFIRTVLQIFAKKNSEVQEKDLELATAGLKGWNSAEWKVFNQAVAFGSGLLAAAASFLFSLPPLIKIELAILGFLAGYLYPNIWLKSKLKQRKEEIQRTLPETLDLIMVSVEAGLGFDAAMMKVVEKQKGFLSDEFNVVLQEIKMGKPRRDALRDMAKKNNVDDLSNVIASLVQADQLGISMGSVLRNQSNQIRQKRKQRAQEQAQKAPVKIMIPLVFFIFPSIFIIILGPAFIQIMDYFSK